MPKLQFSDPIFIVLYLLVRMCRKGCVITACFVVVACQPSNVPDRLPLAEAVVYELLSVFTVQVQTCLKALSACRWQPQRWCWFVVSSKQHEATPNYWHLRRIGRWKIFRISFQKKLNAG